MKATLEFDLLEEQSCFDAALRGGAYKAALDEIWNELRRLSKYSDLSEFSETSFLLDHIKEKYIEIMKDYEIND